jgi:glycosyltransferase involved in cell wall biosynthesis
MKLLFDARWINNDTPDGITRYSKELIKSLNKSIDFKLLISNKDQLRGLPKLDYILTNNPTNPKELGQSRRLNKYKFDIVFSPHFIFGGNGRNFKLIRTVHDLIPFNQKSKDSKLAWKIFYSNTGLLKNLLNNCEGVATVSETVKSHLQPMTKNKIGVVYNAPSFLAKTGVKTRPAKQILYIGRYEEYKNVKVLIKGINSLDEYKLILAGKCSEKTKNDLLGLSKNKNQIEFVGKITDDEYYELLNSSAALTIPSLEEGFGLPIIEAMSIGCPVICSDIEIFREIAGDAGIYFDPSSAEELIAKVKELENKIKRELIVKKSLQNAKKFSWIKSASELKSFLYEIQRGGKN